MKFTQITKEIKKRTWWSEEAPAVPLYCLWVRQFVQQSKFWHPTLPNIIIVFFKNDFCFEETPEDQKLIIFNYLWEKHRRQPAFQKRRYNLWRKVASQVKKEGASFELHKEALTNQQLVKSLVSFCEQVRDHWRLTWVTECADIFTSYELTKLLHQELPHLSQEKVNDLAVTLIAPLKLSFMEHERLEFLQFCLRWHRHISKCKTLRTAPLACQQELTAHAKKYIWLFSNYKEARPMTVNYVWQHLRDEIKHSKPADWKKQSLSLKTKVQRLKAVKSSLRRSLSLSSKLWRALDLLEFWSGWIDDRKNIALVANWHLEQYAREAARRLNLDLWQVRQMTPEEVIEGLKDHRLVPKKNLISRRRLCAFVETKKGGIWREDVYLGAKAKKLWQVMFAKQDLSVIKGQVAAAPVKKIQGEVCVVLDVHQKKFKRGAILVTTMTRPEFAPLMHQAKAIITDEGGPTCHAAIISRELGIPCVIGTKVASKVLKDGDKIEMDLMDGVVKKLK